MTNVFQMLGKGAGLLSVVALLTTVLSIPWMLGGMIPLARLTLLVGAITAALASLLSCLLQRQFPKSLATIIVPLTGLALLGVWQLRTVDGAPTQHMHRTVLSVDEAANSESVTPPASILPANTRTTIGTLLALSLVACTGFDRLRDPKMLLASALTIAANGIAIIGVGISHSFRDTAFFLNDNWTLGSNELSSTMAFATFINPNNAAGWLCLCCACTVGWLTWVLQHRQKSSKHQYERLTTSPWEQAWRRSVNFMADLTSWQILAIISVIFIGTGIAATSSRGGIVALFVGTVLTVGLRSSIRRFPFVAAFGLLGLTGIWGLLRWLEFDRRIVGEMQSLTDLESAAGVRPHHWLDVSQTILDFPGTGTGLGSYQFSTLPYLTQYTGTWFRNADNHYIDMAVEGGIVGLSLFVCIGLIGLMTGFAGWKRHKTRRPEQSKSRRKRSLKFPAAIGTTVVLATLTQAVAAIFDYGIGMPAAASLFMLIIAAAGGCLDNTLPPAAKRRWIIPCHSLIVVSVQVCLIAAAVVHIPEQLAAVEIDETVVTAHHLITNPVSADMPEKLEPTRQQLEHRLEKRPDDPEGLRTLAHLVIAEFRWKILEASRGGDIRNDKNFALIWRRSTLHGIAGHVADVEMADGDTAANWKRESKRIADEIQLSEVLKGIQRYYPMMPKVAEARCSLSVLLNDTATFENQVSVARFYQPWNIATALKLGANAMWLGQPDLTTKLWQASLDISSELQSDMLVDARYHWSDQEAMELFGPTNYADCISSAQSSPDLELRKHLYIHADVLWPKVKQPASEITNSSRAAHLLVLKRPEDAITELKEYIKQPGENTLLIRDLARILESQGHYRDSLSQWYALQHLLSGDEEADEAIERIRAIE